VTLVGRAEAVLPTVDADLGRQIEAEVRRHGVEVANGVEVTAIEAGGGRLAVLGKGGFRRDAELVLVSAGVRPNSELAVAAGVATGVNGAIRVNHRMETNLPGIYAAGDCVETWHRLLDRPDYLPLGTTAHKQGRVAGENAVGGDRTFAGSLGTQVVKVFELAIARTGLREREAAAAGFVPLTVTTTAWDHKVYYPGAHELTIGVTGDRRTGRLLGAQLLGHWQAEVAKRIDVFATALFGGMAVEALNDLDLSYTPPLGSPWDAMQIAAQAWAAQAKEGALVTDGHAHRDLL
jgi:NADPH-dependent 2,4-dienoyl-CoA reductase/sulfur reductase-like enzyme